MSNSLSEAGLRRVRNHITVVTIHAGEMLCDLIAEGAEDSAVHDAISFLARAIHNGCKFQVLKVCEAERLIPPNFRYLTRDEIARIARQIQELLTS